MGFVLSLRSFLNAVRAKPAIATAAEGYIFVRILYIYVLNTFLTIAKINKLDAIKHQIYFMHLNFRYSLSKRHGLR